MPSYSPDENLLSSENPDLKTSKSEKEDAFRNDLDAVYAPGLQNAFIDPYAIKADLKNPVCTVIKALDNNSPPIVGTPVWTNRTSKNLNTEKPILQGYIVATNAHSQVIPYPSNIISPNPGDTFLTTLHTYIFSDDEEIIKKGLRENDKVQIEYIGNDQSEARIIKIISSENKNVPTSSPKTAKEAHDSSTGSTLGSTTVPSRPVTNYNPANLCKDSKRIIDLAKKAGIPPAVMASFRAVESGGNPSAIRFEPHLFNKESSTKVPFTDSGKGFSLVASETNKSAFERAYAINKGAAIRATSWGSYQVLGGKLLSLSEVSGDVNKAVKLFYSDPVRISEELVASWFRSRSDAVRYANNLDFPNLARVYNGPLYANNSYDAKLKQSYEKAIRDCPEYGSINS